MTETFQKKLKLFTYILAALAMTSCIVRNDYNVVFAFLILGVLNKYYNDGPQYYCKIIFQLLAILIVVDIIWIAITLPYWNSSSKTHNDYWESLSFVHGLAILLAFVQIGLKAFMGLVVFSEYKEEFKQTNELFTIHYEAQPPKH